MKEKQGRKISRSIQKCKRRIISDALSETGFNFLLLAGACLSRLSLPLYSWVWSRDTIDRFPITAYLVACATSPFVPDPDCTRGLSQISVPLLNLVPINVHLIECYCPPWHVASSCYVGNCQLETVMITMGNMGQPCKAWRIDKHYLEVIQTDGSSGCQCTDYLSCHDAYLWNPLIYLLKKRMMSVCRGLVIRVSLIVISWTESLCGNMMQQQNIIQHTNLMY